MKSAHDKRTMSSLGQKRKIFLFSADLTRITRLGVHDIRRRTHTAPKSANREIPIIKIKKLPREAGFWFDTYHDRYKVGTRETIYVTVQVNFKINYANNEIQLSGIIGKILQEA